MDLWIKSAFLIRDDPPLSKTLGELRLAKRKFGMLRRIVIIGIMVIPMEVCCMRSFSASAFRECGDLEDNYGFRGSRATAMNDFAALVARPHPNICYYLFIRDDRSGGGPVQAHLWVAPPEFPDDSIDSLGIGIKLLVGETYDFNTNFLPAVVQRVILLLPALSALADVITREMQQPIFHTQRQQKYQLEYGAYNSLVEFSNTDAGAYCRSVFDIADKVIKGEKTYKVLEQVCIEIASSILVSEPILFPFDDSYFQNNAKFVGTYLATKVYIETLVPRNPRS
jgi:hypothetical protein